MIHEEGRRRRWRAAAVALTVLGLAALSYGVAASRSTADTDPIPVDARERALVPHTGGFGGVVGLYGVLSDDQAVPGPEQLGCDLETFDGEPIAGGLSSPAGLPGRVVDGAALQPLLQVRSDDGDTVIRCSGSRASSVQPMYLLAEPGVSQLVPMAAFSVAAPALVFGLAGVIRLRRTGEPLDRTLPAGPPRRPWRS